MIPYRACGGAETANIGYIHYLCRGLPQGSVWRRRFVKISGHEDKRIHIHKKCGGLRLSGAYDFPVVESVRSVLPVVDEFIIVAGDSSDGTDELLKAFDGEPKVRIIRTVWDTQTYDRGGMIYAQQTDVGLRACTGDWCLYIQSDEIMHHDALPVIREACAKYLDDRRVEGFLLKYVHLYGDYRHYIDSLHFAYPREIRIVRNRPDIHSWRDAQSFRVIPDFNGVDYDVEEGTRKLRCILLDALIFHYGWSRDPRCMVRKANHHNALYSKDYKPVEGVDYYDYGNLGMMPLYEGTFPEAAAERMAAYDWADFVRYDGPRPNIGKRYGVKYRVVDFIEKHILRDGRRIGGFKNYKLLKP